MPATVCYSAKRAFAPVVASFRPDGDRLELWISNSSAADAEIGADVSVSTFHGERRGGGIVSTTVAAGESKVVWSADGASGFGRDTYAWVETRTGAFPRRARRPRWLFRRLLSVAPGVRHRPLAGPPVR